MHLFSITYTTFLQVHNIIYINYIVILTTTVNKKLFNSRSHQETKRLKWSVF